MSTELEQQIAHLNNVFAKQRKGFSMNPFPSYEARIAKLKKLKNVLISYQDDLITALDNDFGGRSKEDTILGDILPSIEHIKYTIKSLKSWMKPKKRSAGMALAPAKVSVYYQPKGVIGVIVPWNFPIVLTISPLTTALASGNRVMLKLSEYTPCHNVVLKKMLAEIFDEDEVAVLEGETEYSAAFSRLTWDHLLFTGSTGVGKHVMKAAAENLTPITLELGGKNPVIITDDINVATAVERLIFGKCLNAGQICVSPDYILCPDEKINEFVECYKSKFTEMYDKVDGNEKYGSIINHIQFDRLVRFLDDAKEKGATIISASGEPVSESKKFATQLILNPSDDMLVLQEEIFGPILPIIGYSELQQAIDYVNQRPRPLALYIMSFNNKSQQTIISQTHSGGVCINDTVVHVAASDAPFGGIGSSGMGHYHGFEGFQTFSHAKTVLKQGKLYPAKLIQPPYNEKIHNVFKKLMLR